MTGQSDLAYDPRKAMDAFEQTREAIWADGFRVRMRDHATGAIGWFLRRLPPTTSITLGRTIWLSGAIMGSSTAVLVLRHEWMHARQIRRWSWPLFLLAYLLLLPSGLTVRSLFELAAYRETVRAHRRLFGEPSDETYRVLARHFHGRAYFWMGALFPVSFWEQRLREA